MHEPKFLTHLMASVGLAPNVQSYIVQEMTAPHRHYHTLHHLALMKKFFDAAYEQGHYDVQNFINRHYNTLIIATLFHDIVYDPTAADNEEMSAFEMKMRLPADEYHDVALIERMILATKNHKMLDLPQDGYRENEQARLINMFLEADLSILWTPKPATYEWYARGVRQEYAHVPNELYRAGRVDVLAKLVNDIQPKLKLFEIVALTQNVAWEKKMLEDGRLDV